MKSEKYDTIFELNRQWLNDKKKEDNVFFEKLYEEQNPDFFYIGCSDSRVPASIITGLEIGDLFVHRNIANIVSNNDLNMLFNELGRRLHGFDEVARVLQSEKAILEKNPNQAIIINSAYNESEYLLELFNAGIEVRGKDLRDLELPHVIKKQK